MVEIVDHFVRDYDSFLNMALDSVVEGAHSNGEIGRIDMGIKPSEDKSAREYYFVRHGGGKPKMRVIYSLPCGDAQRTLNNEERFQFLYALRSDLKLYARRNSVKIDCFEDKGMVSIAG
jgi:hypothetical protein